MVTRMPSGVLRKSRNTSQAAHGFFIKDRPGAPVWTHRRFRASDGECALLGAELRCLDACVVNALRHAPAWRSDDRCGSSHLRAAYAAPRESKHGNKRFVDSREL